MRFIESLALWLNQFQPGDERKLAYDFFRKQLIFISESEMAHLVSMVYPDVVQPILLEEVANKTGISKYNIGQLSRDQHYDVIHRQSLFLGLSDGARIDVFRRSAPLSNEQVWMTYDFSDDKAEDLQGELRKALEAHLNKPPTDDECRFKLIFLLDDFSASGISYLRNEQGRFKGKLAKTVERLQKEQNGQNLLVDSDVRVYVVLYVATTKAKQHLQATISNWCNTLSCISKCEVHVIQELPPDIQVTDNIEVVTQWLRKYTDKEIVDNHFRKGKHDKPYLGFDECGLPLVLYHNTPNNSLPILWQEGDRKIRGLFPRVSRHGRQL
jgi:hypothetical protein